MPQIEAHCPKCKKWRKLKGDAGLCRVCTKKARDKPPEEKKKDGIFKGVFG